MFQKIRTKLLTIFLLYIVLLILTFFFNVYFNNQRSQLYKFDNGMNRLYLSLLEQLDQMHEFFEIEIKNQEFFVQNKSKKTVNQSREFLESSISLVEQLKKNRVIKDSAIDAEFHVVKKNLKSFDSIFAYCVNNIARRGYTDFGIEGRMRYHAHLLEKNELINKTLLLTLRRNEKDYIMRGDSVYIQQFFQSMIALRKDFDSNKGMKKSQKDSVIVQMEYYQLYFKELVSLDRLIGLRWNTGLKKMLNQEKSELIQSYLKLKTEAAKHNDLISKKLRVIYFIIAFLICIAGLYISFYLTDKITKPITQLSLSISKYVKSNFTFFFDYVKNPPKDEIGKLYQNFMVLKDQISYFIKNLEDQVDIRTKELIEQKDKIEKQKAEISNQRDLLMKKNSLIREQKQYSDNQNKLMLESIKYAQYIQNALLPNKSVIKEFFHESFIFHKPHEIISGDFYYLSTISSITDEYQVVILGDCFGQKGTGALMSVLAITYLNQIMSWEEDVLASDILGSVKLYFNEVLNHAGLGGNINSGINMMVCVFNKAKNRLSFSSAKLPLFILRNNQINIYKSDKTPLWTIKSSNKSYTEHKIQLEKGDLIYMTTNGIPGQHGSDTGRKFKNKRLKSLLMEIQNKPMAEQKLFVKETIAKWQGYHKQKEDFLMMGIKI